MLRIAELALFVASVVVAYFLDRRTLNGRVDY